MSKMSEKKRKMFGEIGKTFVVLGVMLIAGIFGDVSYRAFSRYWPSWWITAQLVRLNITYTNAFEILRGNFGVIVAMFSL